LNENLPGGYIKTYGLFVGQEQVGFQCWAEYTPWRDKNEPRKLHSNRTVIHPDFCGFGLGMKLVNKTAEILCEGHELFAKLSNLVMVKSRANDKNWKLEKIAYDTASGGGNMTRDTGFRKKVKTFSYRYQPEESQCHVS
jgi:hypothetical protein